MSQNESRMSPTAVSPSEKRIHGQIHLIPPLLYCITALQCNLIRVETFHLADTLEKHIGKDFMANLRIEK